MKYDSKNGKETILAFVKEYLENRNICGIVSKLTDDIIWIGTSAHEEVVGIKEVERLLHQEIDADNTPMRADIFDITQRNNGDNCTVYLKINVTRCDNLSVSFIVRISASAVCVNGEYKIYSVHASLPTKLQDENEFFPVSFSENTLDRVKENVMNTVVPGGMMGILPNDNFSIYFVNENLLNFLQYDSEEEYLAEINGSALNGIHPDDRELVLDVLNRMLIGIEPYYEITYRMMRKGGSYIWVFERGQKVIDEKGREAIISVSVDISQQKEAELSLRVSEERFRVAIENADIAVWEFDIQHRLGIQSEKGMRIDALPNTVENFPFTLLNRGLIDSQSEGEFLRLHEKICKGDELASANICFIVNNKEKRWFNLRYKSIFNKEGIPVRAVGIAKDLTATMLAEQRYREESEFRNMIKQHTVATFKLNITKDIFEESESIIPSIIEASKAKTVTEFVSAICKNIPVESDRAEVYKSFSRNAILNSFAIGKLSYSLEFRYDFSNIIMWVSTTINLIKQPHTGDIYGFIYAFNINEQKMAQSAIQSVVNNDFDYIGCIDIEKKTYKLLNDINEADDMPLQSGKYYENMQNKVEKYICEEDRERKREEMRLENICSALDNDELYIKYYRMNSNEGVSYKKLQFSYLDNTKNQLIVTRTDVTHTFEEEHIKNEALNNALMLARKANAAKSNFVFGVSHQIRTPLNAIAGMTAIARNNNKDLIKMRECVENIEVSTNYLLSMLDDILDMSRIENGKMFVDNKPFRLSKMFESINTIFLQQAKSQQISFYSNIESNVTDYIYGDSDKLQQTLINLVQNAIAYTKNEGKITLTAKQLRIDGNKVLLQFIVKDNGIGISDDFLPHVFDPFLQEREIATGTVYNTGLGLSVSRELMELLGGTISVSSKEGEGSEFVVEVELQIYKTNKDSEQAKSYEKYDFSGKRMLVVEDKSINTEVARALLEDKNMIVETAENGLLGLEKFANSPDDYYDAILMDLYMPVMDGLVATKNIRALEKGRDIPIIAMTADAFNDSVAKSINAGMNAHIIKPISPTVLYKTIKNLI